MCLILQLDVVWLDMPWECLCSLVGWWSFGCELQYYKPVDGNCGKQAKHENDPERQMIYFYIC
jgi:hypothetical protein